MTQEEFTKKIPLARGTSVAAWHECGLIALNKKAGIKAHPNSNSGGDVSAVMARYNFDNEYFSWADAESGAKLHLYLINRLDSPTSGIMLAASNKETADAAKEAFKTKESVKKIYRAIVIGRNIPKYLRWTDFISEKKHEGFVRSYTKNQGANAVTDCFFEDTDKNNLGLSLIRLEPLTGLTHQLRVQCKKRGIPILGDSTYGNFSVNKRIKGITKISRMFLHCAETKLTLNMDGENVEFAAAAPLPDSFKSLLDYNAEIAKKFFEK